VPDATHRKPAFAASFPDDAALNELVDAFARGDYARIRAEAPKLAASAESEAVRNAAKELRARIEPDRLAVGMLIVTGAILVVLTIYWIVNAHAPPQKNQTAPPAKPVPSAPVTVEHVR
jgi:hypothetical protein